MSRPRRSLLRRYLEVRGAIGGLRHPELVARIRTADGVALRGSYLVAAGASTNGDAEAVGDGEATRERTTPGSRVPRGGVVVNGEVAVLLAHGFLANRRKPSYARLAEAIAERLPVLALDMRGHGASGGRSTLGDREALDVEAGVAWLRNIGHRRVVAVGASMGATSVLHAASRGLELSAVVTVSAPAIFRRPPHGRPLAQLHGVWHSPVKRRALRAGFGVRLDGPEAWSDPPHPREMVGAIDAPLLVVHGDDDTYFPRGDADLIAQGASGRAVVWHEPVGFGHAEDGFTPTFVARLAAALVEVATTGRFPERTV